MGRVGWGWAELLSFDNVQCDAGGGGGGGGLFMFMYAMTKLDSIRIILQIKL